MLPQVHALEFLRVDLAVVAATLAHVCEFHTSKRWQGAGPVDIADVSLESSGGVIISRSCRHIMLLREDWVGVCG
jgi:hypothetical protein